MASRPVRTTLSLLWRWSLIITIPVTCFFALWMVRVGGKYASMGVNYKTLNDHVSLQKLAIYEGNLIKRDLKLALTPKEMSEERQLPNIQLYVSSAAESSLNSGLPHSGKTYVQGSLVYPDGDIREVKMRYRGDHFWHWAARKKSLRVKTKKTSLFKRMRAFNLTAPKMPEQISGYMSYFLAEQFGLMVPEYDLVDVYINSEYRGVHLFLEQLEEMVIRKNGKMPGDLYAADVVNRDAYRGLPTSAFGNHGLWEKISINNHFDEGEDEAMERLVECLSELPSEERSARLRSLVDVEAFGRFAAFRVLCQSEHYDRTHNWRLYYDPWRNRFQPVVWDPVGWAMNWRPKANRRTRPDIASSRLDRALLQDHEFLAARQNAIEDYFARGGDEELLAEVDRITRVATPSFKTDPSLTYQLLYMSPEEVQTALSRYRRVVKTIVDHTREDYLSKGELEYLTSKSFPSLLRVSVDGRRPIETLSIGLTKPAQEKIGARMVYMTKAGPRRIDVSGAVVQRGARVELNVPLFAQLEPDPDHVRTLGISPGYRIRPGTYEIILTGDSMQENPIVDVFGRFGDGERVQGTAVKAIAPQVFEHAEHVASPAPVRAPEIWEGDLRFEGVTYVPGDVIIRPGTRLRMAPAASIVFEGQVRALGTKKAPIEVGPVAEEQEPWGVIALRGDGADGSQLSHCQFRLGSGLKEPMAEFSAMLSIHEVDDILVEQCAFADSRVVDDMVHAVYSDVRFDGCTFVRSLFDALDLDITEGVVENCQFVSSGNDALDLMTSTILVENCWIEDSFDKGISVGEDTDAMVLHTTLKGCEIGVQIKDRSRAVLYNCNVVGNKLGVDAYKKNWRYDSGGFGFIYKSVLTANEVPLGADKHSSIRLHDNGFDVKIEETKRILPDYTNTYSHDGKKNPRYKQFARMPQEQSGASDYFQSAWSRVNPRLRGPKPGK